MLTADPGVVFLLIVGVYTAGAGSHDTICPSETGRMRIIVTNLQLF